jgi:hypothetical protein
MIIYPRSITIVSVIGWTKSISMTTSPPPFRGMGYVKELLPLKYNINRSKRDIEIRR